MSTYSITNSAGFKEVSRKDVRVVGEDQLQAMNTGSLMRIADASERSAAAAEKMAASYDNLRENRDMYRRWYEEEQKLRNHIERQNIALRGVITKMKKKKANS